MLDFLWSILGFVVAISVLVCFHEFGHYWVARRMGVKVLRFALGWGRPFRSFHTRDGVEWALAPLPIGGYVKMLDEREGPVAPELVSQAFNRQSVAARMAIVAGGPAANFLLAIALYWLIFVVGVQGLRPLIAAPAAGTLAAEAGLQAGDEVLSLDGEAVATWSTLRADLIDLALDREPVRLAIRAAGGGEREVVLDFATVSADPEALFSRLGLDPYEPPIPPVLAEVVPGQPAALAGFQPGDRLLSRDGEAIRSWQDWAGWLRAHPGAVVQVELERAGQRLQREFIIGRTEDGRSGLFGARVEVPAQLWQDLTAEQRLNGLAAVPAALEQTWQMTQLTLRMLWRMVLGEVSVRNVSGPIQIAQVAGDTAQVGIVSFLGFMAVVSISIGVLNLLPVPLLDGGQLLMLAGEGIKGRPLSEQVQVASQYVGLAFIGMLMMLAFYNDIMRLI
ncbi:MAG TPA: RIP metalloprotease RseP [Nevskiaceae bacterium]|nr:RIP metalloprotease RseP [Nevskiaceae bacterium]